MRYFPAGAIETDHVDWGSSRNISAVAVTNDSCNMKGIMCRTNKEN